MIDHRHLLNESQRIGPVAAVQALADIHGQEFVLQSLIEAGSREDYYELEEELRSLEMSLIEHRKALIQIRDKYEKTADAHIIARNTLAGTKVTTNPKG